jgi:outer membrane protein OmpA-like peptidoglycan-associated protein
MEETRHSQLNEVQLNELRDLIIGLNTKELSRLQKLIRDPHEFANEISDLLPFAVRKLVEKGEVSMESLQPFIEEGMQKSIEKNPQKLADILFPIMGPAIRKAVSEDLKRMIAAINANLEAGLSPKSLKWKLQSIYTRKTYAEIVMANTYLFHVKNAFLIHRQSGLLLHEEKSEKSQRLESDMVSGMLTAIRDFVHDSFHESANASLDVIQVGDLNILIEQGPYAILASVIEGTPPADYRLTLMETIEAVHYNHLKDLEKFNGDTGIFIHTSKFLQNCLISQKKETPKKAPWAFIILLAVIVGAGSWLAYKNYQKSKALQVFAQQIDELPGYYITSTKKSWGKFHISGLKDFDAPDWRELVTLSDKIAEDRLTLSLEPFISADSGIVLQRVHQKLDPPVGIYFEYKNGSLIVKGEAPQEWINFASEKTTNIIGVARADFSMVKASDVVVKDLRWIIPAIEKHSFVFDVNIIQLDQQQQLQFDSIVTAARYLEEYNKLNNKQMAIHVQSYTNRSGNVEANLRVAIQRAERFVGLLTEAGVNASLLEARVLFAEETDIQVKVRSVHFEVFDRINKE